MHDQPDQDDSQNDLAFNNDATSKNDHSHISI
jgi:hypothetical protein